MAYKKITNETIWNTDQLHGTTREELYWAIEAVKGMSGRDNTDTHNIIVLADWLLCYNREGEVKLPFTVEGLLLRPGNPPERFVRDKAEGQCIIIGYRKKGEQS